LNWASREQGTDLKGSTARAKEYSNGKRGPLQERRFRSGQKRQAKNEGKLGEELGQRKWSRYIFPAAALLLR
jgi:hypothetical protein